MEKLNIPYFAERKELFKFLLENKDILIAQKKAVLKHADGISFNNVFFSEKQNAYKANRPIGIDFSEIKVRAIINTTNIMDSHADVHLPGLWKKSLSENRLIMHLQEHKMQFDKIISDGNDLKAYTKSYTWEDLGFKFEGETEALVFDSTVKKDRNKYMHEQYGNGHVKNHSVGMRYVKLVLCINEPDDSAYGAEFEAWEKYFPMIVNAEEAEEKGYFWAIKEAKVIEGSAVPLGSNYATPTLDNNLKSEPGNHSENNEPAKATLPYNYLIQNLTFQR